MSDSLPYRATVVPLGDRFDITEPLPTLIGGGLMGLLCGGCSHLIAAAVDPRDLADHQVRCRKCGQVNIVGVSERGVFVMSA